MIFGDICDEAIQTMSEYSYLLKYKQIDRVFLGDSGFVWVNLA